MTSRDKRVEKAQMRVLFTVPFFAPGVAKLPVVWDKSIETACTDGRQIRWNPDWFDTLKDPEVVTVLCHEVCHPMLGHLWRVPGGADWDLWNQATDHAVNLMLKDFGDQVVAKNLANPFPFPDPQDSYCADPKFRGMAEEVIYSLLNNQPKGNGGKQGQKGQGKGQGRARPKFGEMAQPPGGTDPVVNKKLATEWQSTLAQSVEIAKGRGDLPASIARLVEEIVNPRVPWQDLLRSWLREQCSDDWNWMEHDQTMDESGFMLPSLKSDKFGPIVFATDTSGSIDQAMLAQFQAEKQTALDELRPAKLVDMYCDAKLQAVREFRTGETITKDCPGGGGTDFRPVFDHIESEREQPKCMVYLTDLDGEFPAAAPGYPVIWVVWGTDREAPFGQTIRIDQ